MKRTKTFNYLRTFTVLIIVTSFAGSVLAQSNARATELQLDGHVKAFLNALDSGRRKPIEQLTSKEARAVLTEVQASVKVALLSTTADALNTKQPDIGYYDLIEIFIQSQMHSDYKMFDRISDEDCILKSPRGNNVLYHNKSSLVKFMKSNAGLLQNCTSSSEVIDKSDALVIARVNFVYDKGNIQHIYLIIEKDKYQQWKITQVCKFFLPLEHNEGNLKDLTLER